MGKVRYDLTRNVSWDVGQRLRTLVFNHTSGKVTVGLTTDGDGYNVILEADKRLNNDAARCLFAYVAGVIDALR